MRAVHAITSDALLTADGTLLRPLIVLQDGRIERIASQLEQSAPPDALHLPGAVLTAGFLDIHVHGAGGHDVMEGAPSAMHAVAKMLARHGTTRFLATTVTAPLDATLRALESIADSVETTMPADAAQPIGIHLEGPFLSHAKRGVHPPDLLQPPSIDVFDRFYEASRGHIRLVTVAPETPGALDLIAHASTRGVRISMGHSNATAAETRDGIAAGAVSATHTYNGMRAFDHREAGILGVTLDDDALFAEAICDGVHASPEAVRLWYRSKGSARGILITDGMSATGMPDGQYMLGGLAVDVRGGTCMYKGALAGSVLTMDRAVSNLQTFTGAHLHSASSMASHTPATMLGLSPLLGQGSSADFNIYRDGGFAGSILRGIIND